ncbi:MAG: HAMP domain-containing histidine kinase [Myxococcales bacterium]|nr:HAMP domain-containing histidine kinase [Myxococcales bacterium]MCB9521154.1 HAMP domain-containing histidine kinase [Myxococcales bacterium]MCB9530180.1 HAMP domain-containing histidine kinase [Myxococcales bacterium]
MTRRRAAPGPSLRAKLLAVAAIQAVAIVVIAIAIARVTLPPHDGPHGPPEAGRTEPPPPRPGDRDPLRRGDDRDERPHVPLGAHATLWAMAGVLFAGSYAVSRLVLPPIESAVGAARAFAAGDFSPRIASDRADELGELADALDVMAERVQRALENERALLAAVSHELRTPLARVRVALELIEEDLAASPVGAQFASVAADLGEVESLLDDVFARARLETERRGGGTALQLATVPVDGAALLRQAVDRTTARYPGREVTVDGAPPIGVRVHVVLVRRALENLIENAIKHGGAGAAIRVAVRIDDEGRSAVFEMRDPGTGAGTPSTDVFAPFQRGVAADSRPGLGLGLHLVARIIEAHGGTCGLDRDPDTGETVAWLRLATDAT